MLNFLTFQTFITPTLLLFFYYLGAIFIPIGSFFIAKWIQKSYLKDRSEAIKGAFYEKSTPKQRLLLLLGFILCFTCMEIFWRVFFEFFIAYFDMHQALVSLSKNR